jgi:hypothetical protein
MEKNVRCRKATLAIAALLVAGALYPMTALGGQKLIVKDSGGTNNKFVITDDGTGLSAPDSGYVGVGTASPASALHILGASKGNPSQIKVFNTDATAAQGGGGGFFLGHNNGPAGTPNNLPKKHDRIGYMNVGSIVDSLPPGTNIFAGGFQFNASADWTYDTAQHFPVYLQLKTADTSQPAQTRLVIYPSGTIYIGANFPALIPSTPASSIPAVSQKLEIDGGARLIPQTSGQPACAAGTVGTFWYVQSSDAVQVCTGTGWRTVTLQ